MSRGALTAFFWGVFFFFYVVCVFFCGFSFFVLPPLLMKNFLFFERIHPYFSFFLAYGEGHPPFFVHFFLFFFFGPPLLRRTPAFSHNAPFSFLVSVPDIFYGLRFPLFLSPRIIF